MKNMSFHRDNFQRKETLSKSVQSLSDHDVLSRISHLAREERRITKEILEHLNEVESRRLFAEEGFSSLFEWMVKKLGYSNAAAYRRIQAARLLRELPQIAPQIQSGKLNLTTLAQVQTHLRAEEKQTGQKLTTASKALVVQKIESKSSDETARVLHEAFPAALPATASARIISEDQIRLNLIFTGQQWKKLQRIKELSSHQDPSQDWATLLEKMMDFYLKRQDPLQKKMRSSPSAPETPRTHLDAAATEIVDRQTTSPQTVNAQVANTRVRPVSQPPASNAAEVPTSSKRPQRAAIPAALRRQVLQRDQGQCTYQDPKTGTRCTSRFLIEIDHRHPWAKGGTHTLENLRCLCRTHNQLNAIKSFGPQWMQQFHFQHPLKHRTLRA
ncbi:MAG: HNH endonuclease [Bdellovibrionaceae bacterium]|nr:HNH endonuclease [Pseudobdellovibrionaceae bacterium]